MARINISIDETTLETIDAMAAEYKMNRSECIRFMSDVMDELGIWSKLESNAKSIFSEKHDREPEAVTASMMLRAAGKTECTCERIA